MQTRRRQIEDVASTLFSHRGYAATSMRDIAKALDLQGGSLYAHIPSKEAVLAAIVEEAAEAFHAAVRPVAEGPGTATERLREMTGGRGPDACIDCVGLEAYGRSPDAVYDRARTTLMIATYRPTALRQAVRACRKGGIVSIPGVYGGFVDPASRAGSIVDVSRRAVYRAAI